MENLKTYLEELYKTNIGTSDDGNKYQQTQRNAIRAKIIDAIYADMKDEGFDVQRVDKGVACTFDNEELGGLCFVLAPTMTALDYDPIGEAEDYAQKQARKAEKAAEKAAKAAAKAQPKE